MASVRDVLGAKAAEHPGVMRKRKRWPSTSPQAAAVHPCRCHLRRDQWFGDDIEEMIDAAVDRFNYVTYLVSCYPNKSSGT